MLELCGFENVSYTSKKTNSVVNGYRVYFTFERENLIGFGTTQIFVDSDTFTNYFNLPLGTKVDVYYNQYGKPIGCTIRKEK